MVLTQDGLPLSKNEISQKSGIGKEVHRAVSNAPLILFAMDRNGIFTLSEGRGLQGIGLQPGQNLGRSVFDIYRNFPEIIAHVRRALAGELISYETCVGNAIFETQLTPLHDEEGQLNGVIGLAVDITARVQAETALQMRERRFRALTEHASDLVLILDAAGAYLYASPSHQRILGYAPEELIGTTIFNLLSSEDLIHAFHIFTDALKSKEMVRRKCRLRHANGSWITVEYVGSNCLDDPAIQGFVINAYDVTERTNLEHRLRYQAVHDSLTDLPNRTLLLNRLEQALESAQQQQGGKRSVALLMMDLNGFKEINETFGHHRGDVLLQQVGVRLRKVGTDEATVARLGGDEFAILLPGADEESVRKTSSTLCSTLEEPFLIEDVPLQIEASIGAALYPMHGSDALTLLRRADIAMYKAKQEHESCVFYDGTQNSYSPRRLALIGALRPAIAKNELRLYYQPKIELQTGNIHSVEALVRWQHPEYGFIPPDQFIPLAEQTGLIVPLTHWVLETAIRQCSDWRRAGLNLSIAVNLSMWDLRKTTLPETISALLDQYVVPPDLLCVELTESSMMTDVDRALDVLRRISALGVQVSVDDFGTGYSSLAYLKRLPISELKIDRSFVQHMTDIEADATIIRSTVTMAHSLGLQVVAEGVEDEATSHLLTDLNCDMAQGYYISRPISAHDLENWLYNTKHRLEV